MTNQLASEPIKQGKGASSGNIPLSCLSHATHLKKAARSVEADVSYLNSAFLAERGCLSPGKSQKQTAV
jgi:hypothetical protein